MRATPLSDHTGQFADCSGRHRPDTVTAITSAVTAKTHVTVTASYNILTARASPGRAGSPRRSPPMFRVLRLCAQASPCPQSQTNVSFSVPTAAVTTQTRLTVFATAGGRQVLAPLFVNPAAPPANYADC